MGSSQKRRLARAAKQAQKKSNVTVTSSGSTSAYKIVGGIEPESFELPAAPAIIDNIVSEPSPALEAPSEHHEVMTSITDAEKDGKGVAQFAEEMALYASIQGLPGFDSTFTFGRGYEATSSEMDTQEYTSAAEATLHKRWNNPTVTSYRRISAIFEDTLEEPRATQTNSTDGVNLSRNAPYAPSIFDRLSLLSSEHSAPVPAPPVASTVLTEGLGSQVPVPFGPIPSAFISSVSVASDLEDKIFRRIDLGEPNNPFSAKVAHWTRGEVIRLHQAQVESLHMKVVETRAEETNYANDQALVLYQPPYSPSYVSSFNLSDGSFDERSRSPSQISDNDEDSSWSSYSTGRLFLSSIDGELFVVNPGKHLYEVRIIDETASDFDSIASPTKPDPDSAIEVDKRDIARFHGEDDLVPYEHVVSEHSEGYLSELDDNESFKDIEHYDPFLGFRSFGVIHESVVDDTSHLPQHGEYDEASLDFSHEKQDTGCSDEDIMHQAEPEKDIDAQEELCHIFSTADPRMDSEGPDDAGQTTRTETYFSTTEVSTSTAATDWARELAHTMLGTESLFTFLNELHVEKNGNATKTAVTTAFLQLVDYERHKLGEALLPRSCTTISILRSRILPHTIVLGTTVLAVFLSELEFDLSEETSVRGIYTVFKKLSMKEIGVQRMAATGIMGVLGRALGKII